MKKISILILALIAFTITFNDADIKIVENDVVSAEQWIKDAWAGKVNKCKERLIKKEIDLSIKNDEAVPAGEAAIIEKHFERADYKNRKQRDAEDLKK